MRFGRKILLLLLVLSAQNLFAQTADVSGRYEGTADVQGFGKLNLKAEIRQKNGKLSGVFNTPLGDAPIIEGGFADGVIRLTLDAGGDDFILTGTLSATGRILGDVSSSGAKGSFQLRRVGDVSPPVDETINLQISKEKWREDLRFLAAELPKRHKNAFHRISQAQFEKLISDLDAKIPTLSNEEIVLNLVRITAQIGDGHTGLYWSNLFSRVPMNLFWFGKELRVVKVSDKFPRVNGATLTKIGGVKIEVIYEQMRQYVSQGESEQFTLNASAYLFTFPALLKNFGAAKTADNAAFEFLDAAGKKFSLEMRAENQTAEKNWLTPYKNAPLRLKNEDAPFFFENLPDAKTVYVNFRWYPRRPEFAKFSKQLFDFVDKTQPEKIVFDFRANGGGDYTRGRDFFVKQLKERKKYLEKGRLFALIGRVTYSAGMVNAADFRSDLGAILVGEPSGARPVGYMEGRSFKLPNSRLSVGVSINLDKFAAVDTPGIAPDKLIEPDWISFLAGRDSALEWILAYPTAN